jgi:hypothetical protein
VHPFGAAFPDDPSSAVSRLEKLTSQKNTTSIIFLSLQRRLNWQFRLPNC